MLGPREQSLWNAQLQAEALFAAVVERGLIAPGALESQVSKGVYCLARELFGVKRHWHKRVVRCGPNTVLGYYDEVGDRRIGGGRCRLPRLRPGIRQVGGGPRPHLCHRLRSAQAPAGR